MAAIAEGYFWIFQLELYRSSAFGCDSEDIRQSLWILSHGSRIDSGVGRYIKVVLCDGSGKAIRANYLYSRGIGSVPLGHLHGACERELTRVTGHAEVCKRAGHGEPHPVTFGQGHAGQQQSHRRDTLEKYPHQIELSHNTPG